MLQTELNILFLTDDHCVCNQLDFVALLPFSTLEETMPKPYVLAFLPAAELLSNDCMS